MGSDGMSEDDGEDDDGKWDQEDEDVVDYMVVLNELW